MSKQGVANGTCVILGAKQIDFIREMLSTHMFSRVYMAGLWFDKEGTAGNMNMEIETEHDQVQSQNVHMSDSSVIQSYLDIYQRMMMPYTHIVHKLDRRSALQACSYFYDESIDFLYIDSHYSYDEMKNVLHAWYPKVRPGCMIAGDHYHSNDCIRVNQTIFGVTRAVNEFINQYKLNVSIQILSDWYDADAQTQMRQWYFMV
jgi:hypothetical protein